MSIVSDRVTPPPVGGARNLRAFLSLLVTGWVAGLGLSLSFPVAAAAGQWTEDVFFSKASTLRPYVAYASRDLSTAHSVIGTARFYPVERHDTFLDIARYYGLGYNEITGANPGVDAWIPPPGQLLMLPTEWVLPDVEYKGVVVNIPEMRLYYFQPRDGGTVVVYTYAVGLGRDDWRTPSGSFKVTEKTVNPRWVPPPSIKVEHARDGRPLPDFIAGGDPDNPLGKHRMRLSMNLYGIHGTNIPWGVGMQVSHGCIRLYPEDIERLFPMVPVGTPGQFVYQTVKVGAREGRIFVEVHPDIYEQVAGPYQEALNLLDKFGWRAQVDLRRVERAVAEASGVAIDVTRDARLNEVKEERLPRRQPLRGANIGQPRPLP